MTNSSFGASPILDSCWSVRCCGIVGDEGGETELAVVVTSFSLLSLGKWIGLASGNFSGKIGALPLFLALLGVGLEVVTTTTMEPSLIDGDVVELTTLFSIFLGSGSWSILSLYFVVCQQQHAYKVQQQHRKMQEAVECKKFCH
ncbi:hypothetical protein V6N13_148599 [Hibiscus sabdariffa]|uniref:Uncharacterized protein n=1 Tax=Hibiscus sabdariffa TaxID=183260 RepID=A0ABR2TYX7_9ROSI